MSQPQTGSTLPPGQASMILRENPGRFEGIFMGSNGQMFDAFLQIRRDQLVSSVVSNKDHAVHLDLLGRIAIVDELRAMIKAF